MRKIAGLNYDSCWFEIQKGAHEAPFFLAANRFSGDHGIVLVAHFVASVSNVLTCSTGWHFCESFLLEQARG